MGKCVGKGVNNRASKQRKRKVSALSWIRRGCVRVRSQQLNAGESTYVQVNTTLLDLSGIITWLTDTDDVRDVVLLALL